MENPFDIEYRRRAKEIKNEDNKTNNKQLDRDGSREARETLFR